MAEALQTKGEASRRSQAERTAETRAKIMNAVVESIADLGFQRTTAAEITRRAGVTWGAAQHQFGDKEGILRAVLDESFLRFAECVADIAGPPAPLAERADAFVDGAWKHFGSDHYRSTFEILLAIEDTDADGGAFWQGEMLRSWNGIWSRVFSDALLPAARQATLQRYTVATLTGISSMQMLGDPSPNRRRAELDLLKRSLTRELEEDRTVR